MTYKDIKLTRSYPWYYSGTNVSATADNFVNDGTDVWILMEGLNSSYPAVGFYTPDFVYAPMHSGRTLECHIYYRLSDQVDSEGGGSSGGGSGSDPGGGSSST